ncbi:sulfotransferase [Salinibacter ruber]|uniref:Sulfotransferase domain-containing protein n=1 Tax=Salinibacter ruber TaxID=146919 RepID=A0A9X2Q5W6_9BACT|nr:sulfotransferase [Salinibacter ruber]MCS3662059.1 hypothetical protein [Salinibacter ruber]MCS3711886.1 hypothetical protein [Salinibacter ruber]
MIEKIKWHLGRPLFAAWHRSVRSRVYDPAQTVLVSASPRSGSTWVAEVVARATDASLIWEPLSRKYEAAQRAGFDWNTVVRPGETAPRKRAYIDGILSGRALRKEMISFQHFRIRHLWDFRRFLVKCVRANCLLPWLSTWAPGSILYLVRHPCAVVASQLRHPDFGPLVTAENVAFPEAVGRKHPELQAIRNSIETKEEALALEWAVQNRIALQGRASYSAVVSYEHLVRAPEKTFREALSGLGVENPGDVDLAAVARRESSTVQEDRSAATDEQDLARWHRELEDSTINTILGLVQRCGIRGFTTDPVPSLEAIEVGAPVSSA